MLDGAELGQAIAAHPGDMESALAAYEGVMFARAAEEDVGAGETVDLLFGSGAPHVVVALFTGADEDVEESARRCDGLGSTAGCARQVDGRARNEVVPRRTGGQAIRVVRPGRARCLALSPSACGQVPGCRRQ